MPILPATDHCPRVSRTANGPMASRVCQEGRGDQRIQLQVRLRNLPSVGAMRSPTTFEAVSAGACRHEQRLAQLKEEKRRLLGLGARQATQHVDKRADDAAIRSWPHCACVCVCARVRACMPDEHRCLQLPAPSLRHATLVLSHSTSLAVRPAGIYCFGTALNRDPSSAAAQEALDTQSRKGCRDQGPGCRLTPHPAHVPACAPHAHPHAFRRACVHACIDGDWTGTRHGG